MGKISDNWVVVIAIIILVFAGFIGTSYNKLTGGVVQNSQSTITVNPSVINPGEVIEIKVVPGPGGMNGVISLYQMDGTRVSEVRGGNWITKTEIKQYKTPVSLQRGTTYYVAGIESRTGNEVRGIFRTKI